MTKSKRLNDMMIFLNDRSFFNLKDIMSRYSISKSTAIRDIQSLEEIGMPIYSQPGRNGHYGVLANRLLSPIIFTVDEVFALYFSMLTLNAYETTPFHLDLEKLKKKFENCLSKEKVERLKKIEDVFSLGSIDNNNYCAFLKDILSFTVDEKICTISYQKNTEAKSYTLQFFDVSSAYGQWYATGYNLETKRNQVFRCDKILNLSENTKYTPKRLTELKKPAELLYRTSNAVDFEVIISKKGIDLFQKEHYPSMKLYMENNRYIIRGFYNEGEEDYISNYFISYGFNIISIQPFSLANLIHKKIESLQTHFLSL